MKKGQFKKTEKFNNVFTMMDFCYKKGLTDDNSILEESAKEPGVYILYYN